MSSGVVDVVLRPRRESDVAAVAEMMNMPGVIAGTLRLPFGPESFYREWIREGPNIYAIIAAVEDRAVAQCVLTRCTGRRAHVGEIAICVRDDFAGRGIGDALMAATCELADNWLGLRRLSLEVYIDNVRAIRLYKRHGFEAEGILRAESLRQGKLVDSLVMGRLRDAPPRLDAQA